MADADNTYAVVDMSKKRKNHILPGNDTAESAAPDSMATDDSAMALYATVDKSKKRKNLSSKQETAKKTNSTPPLYDADSTPLEENYSMDSLHHSANQKKSLPETGAETATTMSPSKKAKTSKNISRSKKFTCIAAIIVVVVVVAVAFSALICIAVLFHEITTLKTKTASLQQLMTSQKPSNDSTFALEQFNLFNRTLVNIEKKLLMQMITTGELEQKLNTSINTTSINTIVLEQFNQSLEDIEDDLLTQITTTEELEQKLNTSINTNYQQLSNRLDTYIPIISCAALPPSFPSGYYSIRASNGSAVRVYCDMTRLCGEVTGGWLRVAELNMTNRSHQCPSNLTDSSTTSNIRTCVRMEDPGGCSQIRYSTANIHYSQVCGRITALTMGNPDAFAIYGTRLPNPGINNNYVDGVIFTHGSPRQHIWTFAASTGASTQSMCPCQNHGGTQPPSFVEEDYFCEEDQRDDDPLWDGAGCNNMNSCCSFNTPPWFHKQLPQPTTDDIEMRVCTDEVAGNENVGIITIEIYVQ